MRHRRAKDSGRRSQMDEMEEEGFKEDPAKTGKLMKHNKELVDENECF